MYPLHELVFLQIGRKEFSDYAREIRVGNNIFFSEKHNNLVSSTQPSYNILNM